MKKNKTVIYTAIFGKKDHLLNPQVVPPNCDFVCFTDQDFSSNLWEIRRVNPPEEDPVRKNRRYKILAHKYLPEYEYSVYLDGNMLLRGDVNKLIEKYLSGANIAFFDHNQNKNFAWDCIYTEAEKLTEFAARGKRKEDPELIRKQVEHYRSQGYPAHNGLITGMVILRRHNAPDVMKAMEDWWGELQRWTKRDQLSFNYVAWKNNLKFAFMEGDSTDNPYFLRVGHRRTLLRAIRAYWKVFLKRIKG